MAGRKSTLDKERVIELYKSGHTYRAIAEQLSSSEDAVRMLIKRNAPEKIAEKKAARQAKKSKASNSDVDFIEEYRSELGSEALKEIKDQSRYGINTNESMGTKAFIKACFHSYKTDPKTGRVKFDTSRGARTKDVPASYMPGDECKNTYNCHCLALIPGGDDITKEFRIKAYDNFDAEVKARKRVSKLISSEFTIRFLTVSEVGEIDG